MTTQTAPLTETLTPEVCERVMATIAKPVLTKICGRFANAIEIGLDLVAADGTSPAGERVMAQMNADMDRLNWGPEATRIMRLNVRVVGMTMIREWFEITRH